MRYTYIISALLLLLPAAVPAAAQDRTPDSAGTDLTDIRRRIFGARSPRTDSGAAQFALVPGVSYGPASGVSVSLTAVKTYRPRNAGPDDKLSNIIGSASVAQKGQLVFQANAVVFTPGDRHNVLAEWRYMRYPSPTWGLGARSANEAEYQLDFDYLKLHQSFLWRLRKNLYVGPGLFVDALWRVRELAPPAHGTDYQRYGLAARERAIGPALRLLYDSRINTVNPASGTYASFALRTVRTELGSTSNWQSLQVDLRRYIPMGRRQNVLAFWSYNWLTLGGGQTPYLLLPSTGWDDQYNTGRGYQQGRYRGRNLLYLEGEYRFGITRNGLLGAVAFANAQAFPSNPLRGLGRILPGAGGGLRIKLNKYSATNLAFDYGFGVDGSRFLALNVGEVF
ncbi:hypothetical protein [Flaviaesturariibacter amylovorans]|uniref:BamA/TamA family outer membrane protein n=1 Tax=Flaviaesturariibacter amylovorans TaxID=1084520 RepID=A0ABP8G683_9BACT